MDSLNISLLHKYFTSVTAIAGYLGLSIVTESPNGSFSSGEIPLKCMITRGTSIQETPILQNIDRRSGAPCLSAQRGLQTTRARRSARWDPWHIEDVDRDGPKAVGQQIFARKFSWFIVWSSFSQKTWPELGAPHVRSPFIVQLHTFAVKWKSLPRSNLAKHQAPAKKPKSVLLMAPKGKEIKKLPNLENHDIQVSVTSSIYPSIHPSIYILLSVYTYVYTNIHIIHMYILQLDSI